MERLHTPQALIFFYTTNHLNKSFSSHLCVVAVQSRGIRRLYRPPGHGDGESQRRLHRHQEAGRQVRGGRGGVVATGLG